MSDRTERTEMPDLSYVGVQRYMCTVLEEMRECMKCMNFAMLPSLIEEAQILANRMEAGLGSKKDLKRLYEDIHNLKQARKKLEKEVKKLVKKRDKLDPPKEGTVKKTRKRKRFEGLLD